MLQHEEQEEIINNIIKDFDKNIVEVILKIEKLIEEVILREGLSESTALNFSLLFDQILSTSGYYSTINKLIDDDFDKLYKSIRLGLGEGGFNVKYSEDDLVKITALKNLQLEQFNSLGSNTGLLLQKNLYKYVLSNFSSTDVKNQLLEDLKGTNLSKFSGTLATTAIGDFQQSVIDVKSEGLESVWLYVGVNDKKNRPYCKCILEQNHYYTKQQKNIVMSDKARAYNCRHRARPVSVEFAESNGYTPTKRLVCGTN